MVLSDSGLYGRKDLDGRGGGRPVRKDGAVRRAAAGCSMQFAIAYCRQSAVFKTETETETMVRLLMLWGEG